MLCAHQVWPDVQGVEDENVSRRAEVLIMPAGQATTSNAHQVWPDVQGVKDENVSRRAEVLIMPARLREDDSAGRRGRHSRAASAKCHENR